MTTATEPTTQTAQTKPTAPAKGIQVTEKALVKVRSAMAKEGISPEQGGLRLGVQGGGCSGLSYNIRFDTQPRERDRIFQYGDVRVFVDPKSFIYLHGMTLDYESPGHEELWLWDFVLRLRFARVARALLPAKTHHDPGRRRSAHPRACLHSASCVYEEVGSNDQFVLNHDYRKARS
jgi:iron-sulfur cluster assembly protein